MQFSAVLISLVAAGLASANLTEEPTTTTTLTSTMTSTITITTCNPDVKDCPALTATTSVAAEVAPVVTTSSSSSSSSSSTSSFYFPAHNTTSYGPTAVHPTTVLTKSGSPDNSSPTSGSTPSSGSGSDSSSGPVPTGAASGLRAEHGLVAAVFAAGFAALL